MKSVVYLFGGGCDEGVGFVPQSRSLGPKQRDRATSLEARRRNMFTPKKVSVHSLSLSTLPLSLPPPFPPSLPRQDQPLPLTPSPVRRRPCGRGTRPTPLPLPHLYEGCLVAVVQNQLLGLYIVSHMSLIVNTTHVVSDTWRGWRRRGKGRGGGGESRMDRYGRGRTVPAR